MGDVTVIVRLPSRRGLGHWGEELALSAVAVVVQRDVGIRTTLPALSNQRKSLTQNL